MAMGSGASTILVLILCSAMTYCSATRGPVNVPPAAVFNVLSFGAKPGKNVESTQAFMRAWNAACNFNGKASVFVPAGVYTLGETVFAGPCKNPNPTLNIVGTLKAVTDVSAYTDQGWISFDWVDGLVITGGGTIDGQGQAFWQYNDCKTNGDCIHLPASMHFNGVKNSKIKGINFVNSMGFCLHITNSNLFRVHSISITSPDDSPNTDGIHISKSQSVKISRSIFRTGDDCISIGQGSTNVTINKVTCGPGHGISVGSLGKVENELDVRGLIVKNCTLVGTDNGLRIKTYAGSGPSVAAGILFKNIIMENVKNPILIDQHYGSNSNIPSRVRVSDVVYQNIRGTTITPNAISLRCSSQFPCQNIHFTNINLRLTANLPGLIRSTCENARVLASGAPLPWLCK